MSFETEDDDFATASHSRPHVLWTTREAYQNMQETRNCQYILINGETGSGKTECAKFAVHHLVKMASSCDPNNLAWNSNVWHQKVTASDHLLEMFGNAQTSTSNTSSRFGKLTEVHYDQKNRLEKSKGVILLSIFLLDYQRSIDTCYVLLLFRIRIEIKYLYFPLISRRIRLLSNITLKSKFNSFKFFINDEHFKPTS